MKQDEKQDNLALSQLIQLRSLAFSRQPLFEGFIFVRSQKMSG